MIGKPPSWNLRWSAGFSLGACCAAQSTSGARHVKGVYAAIAAEGVLCRSGIEPIGRQLPLSAEQLEAVERHGKMQDAFFRAHRAVAFADRAEIGPNAEPNSTAMAASMIGFEDRSCLRN